MFDNRSELKRDFVILIKDFNIKPVLKSVKNPQANTTVEQAHKVILNMFVTNDIDNKVFDYIDPRGETLASIELAISDSYQRTIMATSDHDVFVRDILFNLASVIDWQVATAVKKR